MDAADRRTAILERMEGVTTPLPAASHSGLGYRPGEGADLRRWLMTALEPLAERRTLLAEPATHRVMERHTQQLLGGPLLSRCRAAPADHPATFAREVLQRLFPSLSEQRLSRFIEAIPTDQLGTTLNDLTLEKQTLHSQLQTWKQSPTHHPKGSVQERQQLASPDSTLPITSAASTAYRGDRRLMSR